MLINELVWSLFCFQSDYHLYLLNLRLLRPDTCLHIHRGILWLMCFSTFFQSVLNDAGYVPSNTEKYPLGGIISAIENAFHASPQIVCSKDSIEELYLFFYKNFQVWNLLYAVIYLAHKKLKYVQIFVLFTLGDWYI